MIILGETDDGPPPVPLADTLPAPLFIGRIASEVDRMALLCSDIEAEVMPLLGSNLTTESRLALQSIDLLKQTLDALAGVLNLCTSQLAPEPLDVTAATVSVTLMDLRDRLAKLDPAA